MTGTKEGRQSRYKTTCLLIILILFSVFRQPKQSGNDVNPIMRDMMSVLLEGALDEELNEELGYSKYDYRNKETDNSRNGHSRKTMRTSYGDMDIAIPRDRKGEYEPQLIPKYQNTVTQDMEEKIISMYAKGMTTGDIEAHLKELYDLDISDSTINRITDKIMPLVKEWADRAENQNLVSALSITINKILCQFFEFTQNLKRSHIVSP